MRTYWQLTQEQRYQIYALRKTKHSFSEIATVIGVHKSSVSRELKRNQGKRGYRPQQAHELALGRRLKATPRITAKVWVVVEKLLRQDWSPEQISGRLKKEQGICISHEWIYQHILVDKQAGGDLYQHLRCQKKRRKRYGKYDRRGQLPNCRSIEERPASVNARKRLGDWEVDTIIGRKHKQAMVTLTERKSRFTLLAKVKRRTAQAVRKQVCRMLLPVKNKVHTLTSDHGKEFADHEQIAQMLELKFYFAHPYAAWERGTNENTNGLLRQYFPKKSDFQSVSKKEIEQAMARLNFRPRKTLRFKTPFEVFCHSSVALTS
ncbi:MAG: IS30 family transposase [Anaerolineales bacterium]|nr:IS30 family transposase [Moraxellaceae bacterium]MDP2777060.1 IS30 family transposase [Anaerolineales bacterium]